VPASAEMECLPRSGKSTAAGQHWVYRLEGHRKCWFQAAEETATVKNPVHDRAAKPRVATEKETAPRKKALVDTGAELQRSAPGETPQPTPPALKVADAAPDLATGAAGFVPPAWRWCAS